MTVSVTTARSGPYVPNGGTVGFPFTFKAMSDDEVGVLQDGIRITAGFTVTRNSVGPGGTVTFTTAPATGSGDIYIFSDPDFIQDIDFTTTGAFLPDSHDEANDRAAVRSIYLKHRVDQLLPASMLDPAVRAGMYQAYDAAGLGIPASGTGNDPDLRADLAARTGSLLLGGSVRVVNVADAFFGAVGNDSTINDAAFNRAIAECTAGDTLYIPPGTYLLNNSDLQVSRHGTTTTRPLPEGVNVLMDGGAWLKGTSIVSGTSTYYFTCDGDNILKVNIDGDQYPGAMIPEANWPSRGGKGVFADYADNVRVIESRFRNITYGVQMLGGERWLVQACDFQRTQRSGIIFATSGNGAVGVAVRHNEVSACTFEQMGDTAVAFSPANNGKEIAFNIVAGCRAKNTNYLTQGFAYDVEGGFAFGLYHHNKFSGNLAEQSDLSSQGQGGATMNLYSEDGEISGNVFSSTTAFLGDVGISVPGTRRMLVADNQVTGFRGNGINAEGAAGVRIHGGKVHNCGDGSGAGGPQYSAILLAFVDNATAPSVEGVELSWDSTYAYAGANAEGVFANMGTAGKSVTDVSIRNLVLRNPVGGGIRVRGFVTAGFQPKNINIDANGIFGSGAASLFDSNPIAARYCIGLSVQANRIRETENGVDLTGSTNAELKHNTLENLTTAPTLPSWADLTSTDKVTVEGNKFNTTAPTATLVTAGATNLVVGENEGLALTNAVDDAAAAAAGVTVGSKYRNGSVLMKRIA